MENSEIKSIIPTGTSNLAKTEKLLSITQKILSEIKPQYESVKIGNQEWMTRNLDVDRFLNGDLIPHIESDKEWEKAGENCQPAWCYYNNDPENGKEYGKLYNWFAINDPKGLIPEGYLVPSFSEWTSLVEILGGEGFAGDKMKSIKGWEDWIYEDGEILNGNGDNSSGFNALPGGYRRGRGRFVYIRNLTFLWSMTENEIDYKFARSFRLNNLPYRMECGYTNKKFGASVRCLKDLSNLS